MSVDKRTVHTDALQTLGTIITEGGRDAIHLAVEPVVAGEQLRPGQDIGLMGGKAYGTSKGIKLLGIVDPFLVDYVRPGEMFWLVVYPRQITSLRHVWEHPDFPSETEVEAERLKIAEQVSARLNGDSEWIKRYADSIGVDYHELMSAADDYQSHGEYLNKGGQLDGVYTDEEFWDHYEAVTGKKVGAKRGNFFTCSC